MTLYFSGKISLRTSFSNLNLKLCFTSEFSSFSIVEFKSSLFLIKLSHISPIEDSHVSKMSDLETASTHSSLLPGEVSRRQIMFPCLESALNVYRAVNQSQFDNVREKISLPIMSNHDGRMETESVVYAMVLVVLIGN